MAAVEITLLALLARRSPRDRRPLVLLRLLLGLLFRLVVVVSVGLLFATLGRRLLFVRQRGLFEGRYVVVSEHHAGLDETRPSRPESDFLLFVVHHERFELRVKHPARIVAAHLCCGCCCGCCFADCFCWSCSFFAASTAACAMPVGTVYGA